MTLDSERFFGTSSPGGPWAAIAVGSGMGGMTTTALLATLG